MLSCKLRPHHSLCISFFKGEGYSAEFVRTMYDRIAFLNKENPILTLCVGCDIICEGCPNNIDGICKNNNKVCNIDKRVLDELGLRAGDNIRWNEVKKLAYDKIILNSKIKYICADCVWRELCVTE